MSKCNWCGREASKGVYYGHRWYSSSFYCSNRCLNRAIDTGIENPGGKRHTMSFWELIICIIFFGPVILSVIIAILKVMISYVVDFFK